MELHISIFNIISVILLSIAFAALFVSFRKTKNRSQLLIAFSFLLLILSTLTNVIEHISIFKSFDLLEDLLKVLFIPIFIFSVHSSIIDSELKKRMISEKKFKAIFNQAFTFIGLLDKEGRLIEANDSALKFGNIDRVSNTGQLFSETDWWKHSVEEQNKLIKGISDAKMGDVVRFETTHIDADQQLHYIDFSLKPLFDDTGELLFLIPEGRDITEIKNARIELEKHRDNLELLVKERTEEVGIVNEELMAINEELYDKNILLEKSNNALTENKAILEETLKQLKDTQDQLIHSEKMASIGILSAGIAHEINNPINFISSGVMGLKLALNKLDKLYDEYTNQLSQVKDKQLVETINALDVKYNKIKNTEAIKILMGHIETGVTRTVDIVGSLRFFTSSKSDVKTWIDVHEIIESVLIILFNEFKNKIEINKSFELDKKIKCIPGKISQVFMNIISNAIQAIPENGTIQITTRKNGDFAEIRIADNGVGIKSDQLKKIFDPFYTTKPAGKGTGLGLSISYKIVEQHNGTISVNSSQGEGSEFIIRLPFNDETKLIIDDI